MSRLLAAYADLVAFTSLRKSWAHLSPFAESERKQGLQYCTKLKPPLAPGRSQDIWSTCVPKSKCILLLVLHERVRFPSKSAVNVLEYHMIPRKAPTQSLTRMNKMLVLKTNNHPKLPRTELIHQAFHVSYQKKQWFQQDKVAHSRKLNEIKLPETPGMLGLYSSTRVLAPRSYRAHFQQPPRTMFIYSGLLGLFGLTSFSRNRGLVPHWHPFSILVIFWRL